MDTGLTNGSRCQCIPRKALRTSRHQAGVEARPPVGRLLRPWKRQQAATLLYEGAADRPPSSSCGARRMKHVRSHVTRSDCGGNTCPARSSPLARQGYSSTTITRSSTSPGCPPIVRNAPLPHGHGLTARGPRGVYASEYAYMIRLHDIVMANTARVIHSNQYTAS